MALNMTRQNSSHKVRVKQYLAIMHKVDVMFYYKNPLLIKCEKPLTMNVYRDFKKDTSS